MIYDHNPTSELLRLAASMIKAPELASELRIRASCLEAATRDAGGHDSSRRTLLVALGELPASALGEGEGRRIP